MSYSIDSNILLFSSNTASPHHEKAREFLRRCVERPELMYLTWPTVLAYLRIATHPSIFAAPLTPSEAMTNIEALLERPHIRAVGELDGFLNAFKVASQGVVVRGNLVPDAHLAAILLQHGIRTLYSNDRDFRKFSFLKVVDPLV